MKAIIGKKVGMSQIFDENGHVIPVTVIEAGPCVVVQKKTSEKEGYNAVQLGYEDVAEQQADQARDGPPEQGWRVSQEAPARVRPGQRRRAEHRRHREG